MIPTKQQFKTLKTIYMYIYTYMYINYTGNIFLTLNQGYVFY